MATTGIWPVRSNLLALIKYASNPAKTAIDDDLTRVLHYDMNDSKTEQKLYVSGINCLPETAYERMVATKRQFNKTGGVLAYHGYQSFKPGEVTPLQCHQVGVLTAKKLWGDRFEVTVSTHCDKGHLHNHFCCNSISFVDGKKFVNKIEEHIRLREISDGYCRKFHLSVLEDSHFYHKQTKGSYWKNKKPSEIEKEIIKADINEALSVSVNSGQFLDYLHALGYYINRGTSYEHIAVTPPGWNKPMRIDTLMPELTNHAIANITYENFCGWRTRRDVPEFDYMPMKRFEFTYHRYRKGYDDIALIVNLFFQILKMALGLEDYRKRPTRQVFSNPAFRKEAMWLDEEQRLIRFIAKYEIQTPEDIRRASEDCQSNLNDLVETRQLLYNRIRRPKQTDTVEELKATRDSLTKDIEKARNELKQAEKLNDLLATIEREVDEEIRLENERSRHSNRYTDVDRGSEKAEYAEAVEQRPMPKRRGRDER